MSRQVFPAGENGTEVTELSRDEGREFFDGMCRKLAGIPAAEFVRRWDAGEYPDEGHAAHLAMLLPFWGTDG